MVNYFAKCVLSVFCDFETRDRAGFLKFLFESDVLNSKTIFFVKFTFLHVVLLFQNSILPTDALGIEILIPEPFSELCFDLETDFVFQFSLTANFLRSLGSRDVGQGIAAFSR